MRSKLLSVEEKNPNPIDQSAQIKQIRSKQSSLNGLETAFMPTARLKRSASTSKDISHESKITLSHFDFINTENARPVLVKTLDGNSTQETFIFMVNFDTIQGWTSVKESVLWWTDNHGKSFQLRNFTQNGKIAFIYTFPSHPFKMILTDPENKMIYTTEDALVHNTSISVPIKPEHVLPHPTNASKLLIYSYTEQKLFASEDFGLTWTLVAEDVLTPIYWGDPEYDRSENVIHMQIEGDIPTQASYKACQLPGCQSVYGELEKVGFFMARSLLVHKEYIFVKKENQNGSESFLMVSHKRERFIRAQFPSTAKTSDFLILNLDDNQVLVAALHGNIVNLYLSDSTGLYYVLSLENVFHREKFDWFEIDFAQVKGMNWTFMANKIEKSDSSRPSFVQTYVSYDKGGNWAPLFINKTCTKIEICSLLLELKDSNAVDPIRSIDTAPGIILAHGILGQSHQKRSTSIFVTIDGGATWKQIPLNVTCLLRILNHGGLLTAIPMEGNSKIIHYSIDQGRNWESQKFDAKGLSIIDSSSVKEIDGNLIQTILGKESSEKHWKYIKLNMTSLVSKKCEDKDYETWSPKDYNAGDASQKCILGRTIEYRRRKAGSVCFMNETSTLHVMNISACVCTNEDYECDFGYEKAKNSCRKASWLDESFVPVECEEGGKYYQSRGFRKIPVDVCNENDADKTKYDKIEVDCPSAAPKGLSLMTGMKIIPIGKEITFVIEQAQGSKWDTKYTWDFNDTSEIESHTGFVNASPRKHIFQSAGIFIITVTAQNNKGLVKTSMTVQVEDVLTKLTILAPWASIVGHDVKIDVMPRSKVHFFPRHYIHYLWSFGDEAPESMPLLSWDSTMTHTYDKAGIFNIRIEASNSISSVFEEFSLKIFESAVIMELKLESSSGFILMKNPFIISFLTQSLRVYVAQVLGLERDRFSAIPSNKPFAAYLYLFPTERSNEITVTEIKEKIIDQTNKGLLGFDLFGSHLNPKDLIKIVSAKEMSGPHTAEDKKSGPNLTPVYIAVPVLAVMLIGATAIIIVIYRRRTRGSGATRYTLFETHDESDTMLDDEDVAPLNMNLEIGGRGPTLDDSLIDSGGNCLVMESERGMGGNEEIC